MQSGNPVRIEYTEDLELNRLYLHFSFASEDEAKIHLHTLIKTGIPIDREGNRIILSTTIGSQFIVFNFNTEKNFQVFYNFYMSLIISTESIQISHDAPIVLTDEIKPMPMEVIQTNRASFWKSDFVNKDSSFERRVNYTHQYNNFLFNIFILHELSSANFPNDIFKYIAQMVFLKNFQDSTAKYNFKNLLAINKKFPLINAKKYIQDQEIISCHIEHEKTNFYDKHVFYLICSDEKNAEKLKQRIQKTTRLRVERNYNEIIIQPTRGNQCNDVGVFQVMGGDWQKDGYGEYALDFHDAVNPYHFLEFMEILPYTKNKSEIRPPCVHFSTIHFPKEYLRERSSMKELSLSKSRSVLFKLTDASKRTKALDWIEMEIKSEEKKSSPIIMECYSEAAAEKIYHKEFEQPLVIIFANGFTPGGYYRTNKNCNAQEESILAKTENIESKLPTKYGKGLVEGYLGINVITNATIIHQNKKTRAHFAFVAMPNLGLPNPELNTPTENFMDRKAYLKHVISLVMLQFHAAKRLGGAMITGRQGCGVFQNDDEDISAIIRCVNEMKIFEDIQVVYALGKNCKKNLGNYDSQRTLYEIYNNPRAVICKQVNECINEMKNISDMLSVANFMRDNYLLQMKISSYVNGINDIITYLGDDGAIAKVKAKWFGLFEDETVMSSEKIKEYKIIALNDLTSRMIIWLSKGYEPIFILDQFMKSESSCPGFTNKELIFLGRDGKKADSTETSKMLDALFKIIRPEKKDVNYFLSNQKPV